MSTRYTPRAIVARAQDLGVLLFVEQGNIKVKAPKGAISEKMRQVLTTHKADILTYLTTLQAMNTPPVAPAPADDAGDELADTCADCSAPIEDQARDWFYTPAGVLYCKTCRDEATGERWPDSAQPMTREQVTASAQRIAAAIPDGCAISIDPPGYSIDDRVRDLLASVARSGDGQAEYWAAGRRDLARRGYYEQVARDQAAIAPAIEAHQRACYAPEHWTFAGAAQARAELEQRGA